MMTSTFLPAVAPPAPPPLEADEVLDVRPATTPTTPAIRAITATSDNENFSLVFFPDMLSPLPRLSRGIRSEKTFSRQPEPYPERSYVSRNSRFDATFLTSGHRLGHYVACDERNVS